MPTPLFDRRKVVFAKLHADYNVDPVPTAASDAILARSISFPNPLDQEYAERVLVRPHYGNFQQLPAKRMVRINIEQELAGFGSAGPASPTAGYDAMLRMCGLGRAISAGVKVDYTGQSSGQDAAALYFNLDGIQHKITGARANLKLALKRNQIPVITYEVSGLYNTPTDVALPSPSVSAYQVPKVVNRENTTAFSIQGYANACLEELNFDLGNEIVMRNLVNCTDQIQIVDRAPKGSMVIEATKVADKDWWTAIRDAVLGALSITHGTVSGNKVTFTGSNVQLTNPSYSEIDKIAHLGMDLLFMPGAAGNDEITLSIL